MSNAHLTAAGYPVIIAGVEYIATPFDDTDLSEMDNWIQAKYIQNARNSLPENAKQTERDETLRVAMQTAAGLSAFSGIGARMLATCDGMARLIWQACYKRHPGLPVEFFRKAMLDPKNIESFNQALSKLTTPPDIAANSGKKGGAHRNRKANKRPIKRPSI